ncbi:MAG TPA: sulfotransferase [Mariprofundaceae bacterium]|nr:sulfotransferase [Mariprofundaceae bacterium]
MSKMQHLKQANSNKKKSAGLSGLSNNKKRQLKGLSEQAAHAFMQQRFDICEQLFRKIERIQPGNADVANMRGIICSETKQPKEAEKYFVDAINAAPKRCEFHINLGKLYLTNKLYPDALERYRAALQLDVHSLPAQLGCAHALTKLGHAEKAIEILQKAKKRHPRDTDVLMGLFLALSSLDRRTEARNCLSSILERDGNHSRAHLEMGRMELQEGHLEEAEREIRMTLAITPDDIGAYATLAELKKFESEQEADVAAMLSLHAHSESDSLDRMTLSFTLGKVLDNLKQHDRAFAYYREGNDIRHLHTTYHADVELAHLQHIMEAYTQNVFEQNSGLDDATPIFIVGMPRCGSTLTEQILGSHPDVETKGEWGFLEELLSRYNSDDNPLTLERITSFSPEQWGEIGQAFLDRMKAGHPAALRLTDKSLHNTRMVGAIHCAMPNARIIHVRRHPLDSCLSIYKQNFVGQLNDFGCNLGELGYYYRMYLRLMQHWRDVLPAGVMYEMDYERLVANQEEETRKLLDFCGLAWDDRCLQFNKATNVVRTASITQVRRGMYSDSLAAWKRYEKHLQPLIRILGTEYNHPQIR